MYQRSKILQAFENIGLTKSRKAKVKQFLKYLADNPAMCWKEVAQEFNSKYRDINDDIIPVILDIKDPLITSNLLKYLDLSKEKEIKNVKEFIQHTNAYDQERVFMHMAKYYAAELGEELLQKKSLPDNVRSIAKIKYLDRVRMDNEQKRRSDLSGIFEIFLGKDKQYYFHLTTQSGGILLVSEGYKSRAGCQNGVRSTIKNANIDENYFKKNSRNEKHYFLLKAANKKVIGKSRLYPSVELCDMAVNKVKSIAPDAKVNFLKDESIDLAKGQS